MGLGKKNTKKPSQEALSDTLELKRGYVSKLQHKTEKKTPGERKLVEERQAEKQHWVSTTMGRAIVFEEKKKEISVTHTNAHALEKEEKNK